MVITLNPPPATRLPAVNALPGCVDFVGSADFAVDVAALAWRSAAQPAMTHTAVLTPPVSAAIAPLWPQDASAAYRARYDEAGFLLVPDAPQQSAEPAYCDRAEEIRAVAERLLDAQAQRTRPARPPDAPKPPPPPHPAPPPPKPGQGLR
ncbi:hypothetical protein ACIHJG_38790 [Streptomyces sp. NPDC052415]|uniref:hypothetical protein n=1 Tax=Streptomyces sp. NPDC052415 TaxID=3365690 RepID=UPI0037D886B2